MSKAEQHQVLLIEPGNELRFRGPFNEVVTADLKLTNPSEKRVCFKVKTTAPKRYCVRPNSGIIESKGSVSVSVMLQPFEYDPNEKNKHKFMVQTMFAPEGKIENQEQLWKEITPENLMDSKLKCVFEMPTAAVDTSSTQAPVQEEKATSGVDVERKQADEIKRLQSQISQLQKENNTIKADEVRLRKVAMSDTVTSTPPPSQRMEQAPATPMLPSYIFLIVALILGILIGKIIL